MKKLYDKLQQQSSQILVSCSLMGFNDNLDKKNLKEIATSIDNLYDVYAEIMKRIKTKNELYNEQARKEVKHGSD